MAMCVDPLSLVGRVHEMVGELQRQGRLSCAEINTIYALTMHSALPDFFRSSDSSPIVLMPDGTAGKCAPAWRAASR